MTEKYTPEKVADLIAELRNEKWEAEALARQVHWRLYKKAADTIEAVITERDEEREARRRTTHRYRTRLLKAQDERDEARAERDEQGKAIRHLLSEQGRLRRAITEALAGLELSAEPGWPGWDVLTGTEGILRAALDKEGNDDE